jgi:hypothetical protein
MGAYQNYHDGAPSENVHIALIPTDDWTTIPAHLRWGWWNACPAPEYHVAALRAWRDRFGAELVALGSDTVDVRLSRPPQSREEALDLARDHFIYCSEEAPWDRVETLSQAAAYLLGKKWWNFWWD